MATQPVILSGVQAIDAVREVRKQRRLSEAWPFAWVYPPPGSKHVFQASTSAAPANAVQILLVSYQVPDGMRFFLTHLVLNADLGAGWHAGDGSVTWSVDVNRPLGASNAQGIPFKDYGAVQIPLGSWQIPWAVEPGENSMLSSLDTLRIKAITAAGAPVGAPNYISAAIRGYTCPA